MPSPPAVLPFPIPDSILLIIHLHLLQCPLQLDPNMFNPNMHGIGDRIKTMEHIVHFLMAEAEGHQRIELLLPMYPTKKPADTVAFRNAVVKYLEGLRAVALKPPTKQPVANPKLSGRSGRAPNPPNPSQAKSDMAKKPSLPPKRPLPSARSVSVTASSRTVSTPPGISSKQTTTSRSVSVGISKAKSTSSQETKPSAAAKPAAPTPTHGWWWKDVPVRKSLLEECTGARFERLLLALGIHVLVLHDSRSNSSDPSRKDALVGLDSASNLDMFNMLCEQPDDYRDLTQRLSLLQLRLFQEEHNLSKHKRAITLLKASIPSNIPSQQPSIEELQAQISDLISRLDPSWDQRPGPEELSGRHGADKPVTAHDPSMLRWVFALAGASRQLQEGDTVSVGTDDLRHIDGKQIRKSAPANASSLYLPSTGAHYLQRKTILPAPPLPTVAARHSSHIDALGATKEKVSNLRLIQESTAEDNGQADDASVTRNRDNTRPQELTSAMCDSLLGQEISLSDSVKRFMEEMAELEDRLERELEIKQSVLFGAYEEENLTLNAGEVNEHEEQWLSELPQPLQAFNLDFEMESTARLPPVLCHGGPLLHHLHIANSIQAAIENALDSARTTLTAELEGEWDEGEEEEYDPADVIESDDEEDIANRTIRSSPIRTTRIPSFTLTPKRDISLMQPKSSVKSLSFGNDHPNDSYLLSATPKPAGEPSTPPRKDKQRFAQNLPMAVSFSQTPLRRSRQKVQATPVRAMATPSFFYSPGDGMEDLKNILPPFQSPWRSASRTQRSPRKSGRMSIGKPRVSTHRPRLSKGRLASSSSFVRTPLKSGKRLSSIVPPVSFPFVKLGQATPRASLDDVYEELVDDLVKSTSLRTPPSTMKARRLLDSKNNIQRSSPFKNLTGSGRAPLSPQSPDDKGQEVELSFGTAAPLTSHADDWGDVLDDADGNSTVLRPMAKFTKALSTPRFSEGPSFTLRDMLLKVGQDGMLGANGTFNFDLLEESEVDVGNDSMFDGI